MKLAEPPTNLLADASLFLDFDGTLVELVSRPDAVEVGTNLRNLLVKLRDKLDGRVAILSGRAADDLRSHVGLLELAIAGSHGSERSIPGRTVRPASRPSGLDAIIATLRRIEADNPGILVEEKPAGVAIHYRLAPWAEEVCHDAAERAAMAIGMVLQHGKMVVELKPAGVDKGSAVRAFMAEPNFVGTRPIFIGDDLTDEHGFVAVREWGGEGVLVGPQRPTAANYRLENVMAVRCWLETACEELP